LQPLQHKTRDVKAEVVALAS